MKNIVAYHNTERMGYSLIDGKGPFTFYTNKPVSHLMGAKVWAIASSRRKMNSSRTSRPSSRRRPP